MSNRIGTEKLVARQYVLNKDAKCIHCCQPFVYNENVFTHAGKVEISISGICERCFDGLFEEYENE